MLLQIAAPAVRPSVISPSSPRLSVSPFHFFYLLVLSFLRFSVSPFLSFPVSQFPRFPVSLFLRFNIFNY
jgi:hypothetical protein